MNERDIERVRGVVSDRLQKRRQKRINDKLTFVEPRYDDVFFDRLESLERIWSDEQERVDEILESLSTNEEVSMENMNHVDEEVPMFVCHWSMTPGVFLSEFTGSVYEVDEDTRNRLIRRWSDTFDRIVFDIIGTKLNMFVSYTQAFDLGVVLRCGRNVYDLVKHGACGYFEFKVNDVASVVVDTSVDNYDVKVCCTSGTDEIVCGVVRVSR